MWQIPAKQPGEGTERRHKGIDIVETAAAAAAAGTRAKPSEESTGLRHAF